MPGMIQTCEKYTQFLTNFSTFWNVQFEDIISQDLFDRKDENHYMYIIINTTGLFQFSFVPHVHYVYIL